MKRKVSQGFRTTRFFPTIACPLRRAEEVVRILFAHVLLLSAPDCLNTENPHSKGEEFSRSSINFLDNSVANIITINEIIMIIEVIIIMVTNYLYCLIQTCPMEVCIFVKYSKLGGWEIFK